MIYVMLISCFVTLWLSHITLHHTLLAKSKENQTYKVKKKEKIREK